ncbi:PD40 domain-containing protein, partial [bacterium]|nr:PD40 domain-containing protein [bacterium]
GEPLTRTGELVGTPAFMAPEQAAGGRAGATTAADVFGIGAVLYACLTGRPPGESATGAGAVSPRRVNPAVPRDLEAVCLKCLEPAPGRRYASAQDAADDLDRFLSARPTHARPVGPVGTAWRAARRRPRVAQLVLVTALALAALPAVTIWFSLRLDAEAAARAAAERDAGRDRELAETHEFYAALERVRARRLNGAAGWPGDNLGEVRRVARFPPATAHLPDLRAEAAAALAAVDLPPPRVLTPGFHGYAPAFHPDGTRLAVGGWGTTPAGECQAKVIDLAAGAELRSLTYPTDTDWNRRYGRDNADGCRSIAFSPDGRWLVIGTRSGRLVRWDLSGANPVPVVWPHAPPGPVVTLEHVRELAFTPDGRLLVSAGNGTVVGWDVGRGWAEAFRAGAAGQDAVVVRPARAGDPVSVTVQRVGHRVTTDPPGLIPAPLYAGARAAGPGGELVLASPSAEELLVTHGGPEPVHDGALRLPGDDRADDGAGKDAVVHPGGEWGAASAEHRRHLKLWSVTSGLPIAERTLTGGSLRLAFHPGGGALAVVADTGVLLYPLAAPQVWEPVGIGPAALADADLSPDGRSGAGLGVHPNWHRVGRWWADGRRAVGYVRAPVEHRDNNRVVAVSPDGRRVETPLGTWVELREPPSAPGRGDLVHRSLRDLRSDPAGRIWSVSGEGLRVCDPPDPTAAHTPAEGMYDCVAPGARAVWAGRTDGVVCRHPAAGGAPVAMYPAFSVAVAGVAQSPDGRTVVAGSVTGAVVALQADTGEVVASLPAAHRDAVPAVAALPNGWFATGSRDRTVKVWKPGGELYLTLVQTRPVRRLFASQDGAGLTVLAEGERGLRRWNLVRLQAEFGALGLR